MAEFFTPQKHKKEIWYKEPWMLLVVGGPVVVVFAGFFTFYLAWQGADKVVAKDYYKQGLNINKAISRDAKASELKMQARVQIDNVTGKLILQLEGNAELPPTVLFSASTRSSTSSEFELLRKATLTQVLAGKYEGVLKIPAASDSLARKLWHVKIESEDWRLTSDWQDPLHSPLQIKPQTSTQGVHK